MHSDIDLGSLTVPQKDALILSLLPVVGQLQAALAEIAELQAQIETLTRPPKTPDNSSHPPSSSRKANRKGAGQTRRRRSGPGIGRALHDAPDRTIELFVVTRVHLFGGRCGGCGTRAIASAPAGLQHRCVPRG